MLSLTLGDYQLAAGQIVIRHAKGDEPRVVPISPVWAQAVDTFLLVRPKVESGLLFVSEYGDRMDVDRFGKRFRGYLGGRVCRGSACTAIEGHLIGCLGKTF